MKQGISIVVPCFNEEGNIVFMHSKITDTLLKLNIPYEILFVDDCSQDGTAHQITALSDPHVNLIRNTTNQGLFKSWIIAVKTAQYDLCCLIDADGQNPPQEIRRLYEALESTGSDFVQGERSSIGRLKDNRYFLSKGLNLLLKILFNDRDGRDVKSGFVLANTDCILNILTSIPENLKTSQSFIKIQANLLDYNVSTIETLFLNRNYGASFIKKYPIKLVTRALVDITLYFLYYKKNKKYSYFESFLKNNQPAVNPRKFTLRERILMNLFFITFPLHKWAVSRNVKQLYLALRQSQFWDQETLERYQNVRLKKIFNHAYFNTVYYRKLFDSINLNPRNFSGLKDLPKINSLTKDIVNQNLYFELLSKNHNKKRMYKISTSGSTGTPFSIYVDYFQLEMRMATTMRAWENAGWRFGERQVRLWHQTIGMSKIEILREKIDAMLSGRRFIPAFEINEQNIHNIKSILEETNPSIIDGYAECLTLIARYQKEKINIPNLKAIISSAQMLTDDTRAIIENIFGVKVIDKYGAREFSGIAYEINGQRNHVLMSDSYILNRRYFSDDLRFIEITDLNNTCVPIINYQLGDLCSEISEESAKFNSSKDIFSGFPRLGKIEGRSQSVLKLANGKLMPSAFFLHFMKEYEIYVKHFQFIQKQNDEIHLKIVANDGWNNDIRNQIDTNLRKHLGECELKIMEVDEIKLIRTGKRISVMTEMD